jgi:hypothetical protein
MSPSTSLEDRRVDLQARVESYRERAGSYPSVVVDSVYIDNASTWRRFVDTALPAAFDHAERQLGAAEDELARVQRLEHEREARAREYDGPNVHAGVDREREEAARAASVYASSNGAKLDRIEALLERIATGLEKRG